ncbi:MAG TPA: hypothetical protein VKA34_15355 [Balneolales bacterium]|nr:hypothetical protein [Balneolales bacterium]
MKIIYSWQFKNLVRYRWRSQMWFDKEARKMDPTPEKHGVEPIDVYPTVGLKLGTIPF